MKTQSRSPRVISASRRTDMPAWYLDVLVTALRKGSIGVANPYSGTVATVDLAPEAVHTLVLWSKDFGRFLRNRRSFAAYNCHFLFTVNDMPSLEPGVPPLAERLDQMTELASAYGPDRIGWRYDPVVFTADGPCSTHGSFARIADRAADAGITRVITSFLDIYGKVRKRNDRFGLGIIDPPPEVKHEYLTVLHTRAAERGMSLSLCCEPDMSVPGVGMSSCIDGELLGRIAGTPAPSGKDPGQRKSCRCTVSRDIGSYRDMPCRGGCLYCYANPVVTAAASSLHDSGGV